MTEEQLKQLTDFAAAKRTEDLLKIREEIAKNIPLHDGIAGYNTGFAHGIHKALSIIDKYLNI